MLGTIVNVLAIIAGGLTGMLCSNILPEKIKETVIQGLGLAILLIGFKMALETNNPLIMISSMVIGGVMGEIIDVEEKLNNLGVWLQKKLIKSSSKGNFINAFVSTSLIYCVGAMAIMGSLQSGLEGKHDILYAKAMLDGISAIVFASSMGIGVLASTIPVFIYQGSITLSASLLQNLLSGHVIAEMNAVGGLLIMGIGLSILEIKKIKIGNLLPAIFVVVPLTMILEYLKIG